MERELWLVLYRNLRAVSRHTTQKHVHYPPWVIAAVLLWAALHDRPVAWACKLDNWSTTRLRPPTLPSASTVSRRRTRPEFQGFLDRFAQNIHGDGPPAWELMIDGKPLPVGRCSKDPDAKGTPLGRGYKLHAIWGQGPLPDAWEVTSLREYEGAVAKRLLARIHGKGYLLADGNYESSALYDAAAESGYQLLAEPDERDTGEGHRYQSPYRLQALRLFEDGLGGALYRDRSAIERNFGNAGSFGGGLSPLPNWVRRQRRVEQWVWCKLMINAARIFNKRQKLGQMQ